ncbi:MAG: T9SS type A sorting domain-containing protein [Bacteroidetes bacterium]|nr:MAG: T9SS type A sorting domain-containing protein [Bacteroidota bacterium]
MKRLVFLFTLLTILASLIHADVKYSKRYNKLTKQWVTYPEVTIHDIQYVPQDSLLMAEAVQIDPARWTLQTADRVESATTLDDTVTITGLCVIPPKIIGYTANGYTMVLYDTGVGNAPWSGIVVRCNAPADTLQNIADGFLSIERGDIVKITGRLSEFPAYPDPYALNGLTQFQPIPGISIDLLNPLEKAPIPPPIIKGDTVEHIYEGIYNQAGPFHIQYSTGEPLEGMIAEFTNLTITGYSNVGGRNAIIMRDAEGNTLAMHDASRWFTVTGVWRDSTSTWTLPPVFAVMDTIRGLILQISGTSSTYGYPIAPMFPGDVVFGVAKPTVSGHQRIPNVVKIEELFEIRASATQTVGGYPIDHVICKISQNYGPFTEFPMTLVDTPAVFGTGPLTDLPNGTFVRYFIEAYDDSGNFSTLAYQGVGILGSDTSQGFFNFTVLDHDPTIRDIQYTPYAHGISPYYGGSVTLRGIVTADSSDMELTAHSSVYGTHAYFLQSGNQPWSGIWLVTGTGDSSLAKTQRGDSIEVTGTIGELGTITQLYNIVNTAVIKTSGNALPAPLTLPTSTFASGNPAAEQYEGMLVRVVNSKVTALTPIFSDPALYEINDGSGAFIVGPDGKNTFTTIPSDTTLGLTSVLLLGDDIDTLTGIIYNAGGTRFSLCPRNDDDYVAGGHVDYDAGWNIVSIGRTQTPSPAGYHVSKLYPGAASQPFKFAGTYVSDTSIWHGIGYWLKFSTDKTFRRLGIKRTLDTMYVVTGWNLVGMIGDSIAAATVTAEPLGNTLSSFFGYKGGYNVASTLQPNQGFWVKASMDGFIIMSNSGFAKSSPVAADLAQFNSLTIEGKDYAQTLYFGKETEGINLASFEMPPVSPEGAMDARFTSGRILETYPADIQTPRKYPISVKGSDGPVTLKWNIVSADKQFTVTQGTGKNATALAGRGETKLNKTPELLYLGVVNGNEKPREFSMSQNYPNPFNPTTQFMVSLPQTARLEVAVFNVLGQKIATLVNETREAGSYPISWNSTTDAGVSASSGVYFVKMLAGDFTSVKKIVLMK